MVEIAYPVPVITMSTVKLEMPLMLDDTLRVIVAVATWFTASVVPSWFHVTVIGPLALAGFQFDLVMLSVTWTLPVFLT